MPASSPTAAPGPPLQAAPVIPDYELLRIIGRGSYGDVWLARGVTGLYRAVKLVWRARFQDLQPYEREFKGLREFAAISLSESRQLALLHVGRNDGAGFFYYVMELADDVQTGREIQPDTYVPRTLKAVRETDGRLLAPAVVALGVDLARGLAGLHARGLVHRDVKPSNVIFVGGAPKLADIGLVTAATSAQTFVGTEGFVPPEGPGTPAADVFSLGKLLYETVTGLDRNDYPRLPPELHALPDRKELLELNEILIRACDPAAAQRYSDATALLDELLLLQAGRSMRRLRAAERRLSRAVRIGTLLALVAAVAGTGAFFERRRAESENSLRRQAERERDDLARKTIYAAGLARAQRALELGDLGRARDQLQEIAPRAGAPDLRGFEWHALWSEAQGDPADVLRENGPAAEKVRFSTDGRWLAVHTADKRITLWDTATKKIVRTLEGVHRFAGFSSDGAWLVGSDPSYALQRWTVATGAPDVQPPAGTNRPLAALGADRALAFTDGTAGQPHVLRTWDFSSHRETARVVIGPDASGTQWDFFRHAVSADGGTCALVLIAGRDATARWRLQIFDVETGRRRHDEILLHRPYALALTADGASLAMAYIDTVEVELRTVESNAVRWHRPVGTSGAYALTFSPDDRHLVWTGRDALVRVVDAANGEIVRQFRGHAAGVPDAAWSPRDGTLVSAGTLGDVRLWPQLSRQDSRAGDFWASATNSGTLSVSPDGRRIAVTRDGQRVDVLAADTLEVIAGVPNALSPVAFLQDGSLVTLTPKGGLQFHPPENPAALQREFAVPAEGMPTSVAFSPDGRQTAIGTARGGLEIRETATGRLVREQIADKDHLWSIAFSPDGKILTTLGSEGHARVWQAADGTLRRDWPLTLKVGTVAFSPRGDWLALGTGEGEVELCETATLATKRTLRTGSAFVTAVVFSPDGSRLIVGGSSGLIQIFAADDGREVLSLTAGGATGTGSAVITRLAMDRSGHVLAAYRADGRVRVWRH